ncbi:3D-(3,5/4)-trihydroxycyclohexane-1,2-dione acylhydrolase (decyclizing) [Thiomonas sp. FB-6]|uniref:3D-(3,5/4)-trihydroxycyclohexane-1,2-dione acylhydrolase (decyclizing) n=1 Tax=Thiomonas sp. FB-6 TaxID=1158291 RepID=UPI0003A9EAF1|nr:3D-(3,5/4)-trihydroxycyclohexane-1,2-dione acylhydrolase (decyclizing) [Thiomonas sp. FB-6]
MSYVRMTMAQALVRHLAALKVETADGRVQPYCAGVFAIFGHGNVCGLGEALWEGRAELPTLRAHNEQSMAHAAIAFAKASMRQRIMAVTTSIGPGATNLATAAALAHVNRLPVLLLPGDTFASRRPDPVLQQLESFHAGDLSVNDCLRPLTRYFDRITRPEQILVALPQAIGAMTDPANCGPACLALCQDVQTQAFDCPERFLHPPTLRLRRAPADAGELERATRLLRRAERPLILAGGGVLYSHAGERLRAFAEAHGIPVAETHGGKSSLPWDHPLNVGAIGVDGAPAANALAEEADLVFAVGTRLQDFTTGSHALYPGAELLGLNVQAFDAAKWHGHALVADARTALEQLEPGLQGWRADPEWSRRTHGLSADWVRRVDELTTARLVGTLPYDAEVIGGVRDSAPDSPAGDVVVCAAGTLPAELHKLWRASRPGNYHVEYGYSCMGYEIAGGLGVKLARPEQEVVVMVGDGSYLMLNSELATSVMLGRKLIVVVLDNRGFGCIERLQASCGYPSFNNLLDACVPEGGSPVRIDLALHARSLGAEAVHVRNLEEFGAAMREARGRERTQVIVIDTTHARVTADGGCWWDVAMPELSSCAEVRQAHARYELARQMQCP